MSNLYTTTATIHQLLPQIKDKYGLKEINLFNDYYIDTEGKLTSKYAMFDQENDKRLYAIQADQIRQILIGLKEVLGRYMVLHYCQKWLNYKIWNDDVDTLFNRKPETVLKELIQILKKLI